MPRDVTMEGGATPLRVLRTKTFSATALSDLESDINGWLDGSADGSAPREAEIVGWSYQSDGTNYTALVLYTQ